MQDCSPSAVDDAAAGQDPQGSSPAAESEGPPGAAPRRRWDWHRTLRLTLEAGIGVIAGLAILGGIAVWRLSSEPVRLDFLTPYMEQAFNAEERGLIADVGETLLTWEGWPRNVDLRVRRLLLHDPDGRPVAFLPDVSVTLSLRALLKGKVAPTYVEVIRPQIVIERLADGRLMMGSAQALESPLAPDAAASPHGEGRQVLRVLIEELLEQPDPERELSFLTRVRVEDAHVALRDAVSGEDWQASGVVLDLRRAEPGVSGEMAARFDLPGGPAELEVALTYDKQTALIDLASSFEGLHPVALPGDWPAAEQVRGLDMALGGSITATLSLGGQLDAATFDISGEDGLLDLGERLPEPRPVHALRLSGTYDGQGRQVLLHTAELDFGRPPGAPQSGTEDARESRGPAISLTGEASLVPGRFGFLGEASVAGLQVNDFPLYWPRDLAKGARAWIVENIKTGTVESARMSIALGTPAEGPGEQAAGEAGEALAVESLEGEFRYRNLDVHYLRPMPPVRAITGSATFDMTGMRFKAQGGRSGEIEIGAAEISIEGFDRPGPEIMDIKFPAEGPLRDTLLLLNHERLGLIDKLGLDPEQTSGRGRSQTVFRFPLLENLPFSEIEVATQAELYDVAVGRMLLGKDATEGRLSLALDKEAMWVRGPLKLDGVALEVDWRESFGPGPGPRSQYQVLVPSMNDAQRASFGFDVLDGLSGPVSASLIVVGERDDTTTIEAALNLEQATLALPELYWAKPAGEAGEARLTLFLVGNKLTELRAFTAQVGNLSLSAEGRFDEAGKQLRQIHFDRLSFADNDLTDVTATRRSQDGLDIEIGGGVLNAEPFLEREEQPETEKLKPPLRIVARNLRSLAFGEGRYLEEVSFALDRPAGHWEQVQLLGQVPKHLWQKDSQVASVEPAGRSGRDGRYFEINYRPKSGGGNRLDVVSNDAGAVLRALDLLDTMEGGELVITGERPAAGEPLQASIEAKDFTMVDAPVLAEILLVASLTGIVEALSSDGIPFDRLVGEFTAQDNIVKSDLVRAYGGSLGITSKGEIDLDSTQFDLRGSIVPIYGLNQLLSEIPVLGTILTGGEGEGFVAFTYDLTGDFDDPQVSVNPLSALAPGWLRGIFSGEGLGEEPTVFPQGRER